MDALNGHWGLVNKDCTDRKMLFALAGLKIYKIWVGGLRGRGSERGGS